MCMCMCMCMCVCIPMPMPMSMWCSGQVRVRTGCHVDVGAAPQSSADQSDRLVLLSGSGRAQLDALREVALIVSQAMVALSLVAPPLKWLIPADATPLVLGRNGGGIREVITTSGANVIVAQQTLGGPGASPHVQGTRVVSASGTIDAVVAAARIVLERIYGA